MKKIKSVLCLLLALIMLLSLAACVGKDNTDDKKPQGGNNDSTINEGGDGEENPYAEPVSLKWMASDVELLGRDEVDAEVKRYVKEKLNIDLDIFWYPASDTAGIASSEIMVGDWDISCVDSSTFKAYGPRNLFLDLKPYLEQGYLPTAQEQLPESAWDAATYNDQILAVSAYKDLAENWGMILNKTMMDEYGLEVPENWQSMMEFLPTLYEWTETYRAANPGDQDRQVVEITEWLPAWLKFECIVGEWNTTLVAANIPDIESFAGYGEGELFCPYFTDEYLEYVRTLYKLVQDGIVSSKIGQLNANTLFNHTTCGYIEIDPWMYRDFEVTWAPAGNAIISTGYLQSTLYVVNRNCENPERALEFMELLYSDEYLCTTLKFGVEGKDWTDEDDNDIVEMIGRNQDILSPYWYDWYGGRNSSVLCSKVSPAASADFREKLLDLNSNSILSDNAGFIFNQEPVLNEVAACTNAMARYVQTIRNPLNITDPDKLVKEFRDALTANGIDVVLNEAQRQLDEWRAAKSKG